MLVYLIYTLCLHIYLFFYGYILIPVKALLKSQVTTFGLLSMICQILVPKMSKEVRKVVTNYIAYNNQLSSHIHCQNCESEGDTACRCFKQVEKPNMMTTIGNRHSSRRWELINALKVRIFDGLSFKTI